MSNETMINILYAYWRVRFNELVDGHHAQLAAMAMCLRYRMRPSELQSKYKSILEELHGSQGQDRNHPASAGTIT